MSTPPAAVTLHRSSPIGATESASERPSGNGRKRWIRWAGMFAMTFGAVAGCDAPAEIRPGDIRTYAIPKAPADTEEASAPSGSEAGTSAAPEEAN